MVIGISKYKNPQKVTPLKYAAADARAFYEFIKTMETYQEMLDEDSTMVFTTQSDIFKFLKRIENR